MSTVYFQPRTAACGCSLISGRADGWTGNGWLMPERGQESWSNRALPFRHGGLWAYLGGGVIHLRADGGVRRITSEDGLPNERVTSIIDDQEGNVWLGFNRGGLVRVRERRIQVLGVDEGLANKFAISLAEDADSALWVANYSGGVCRWKDGHG
jgi:ligand-binding sensor domain-containing protein